MTDETQMDQAAADDVLLLPDWLMAAIRSELLAGHGEDDDPGGLGVRGAAVRCADRE